MTREKAGAEQAVIERVRDLMPRRALSLTEAYSVVKRQAYLLMNELNLMGEATASHGRGYIRHWLGEEHPPDQTIRQVFTAAERILKAGRVVIADTSAS